MGMRCGINGCKKLKVQPHVHTSGGMGADPEVVETYRIWAQMRGESLSIPGGDGTEANNYMVNRMKIKAKDAKKFREQLSREIDAKKKKK